MNSEPSSRSNAVSATSRHPAEDNSSGLTRERLLVIALGAATCIAIYLCYRIIVPFLPAVGWALALAIVVNPLHDWLCRRLRPQVAATVTVLIVTIVILGPVALIGQQLISQATDAMDRAQSEHWGEQLKSGVARNARLASAANWIQQRFEPETQLRRAAEKIGAALPAMLAGSAAALGQLFVALFTLFFFMRDKRRILRTMRRLVPLSPNETDEIFDRIQNTISATLTGHILVRLIQGALGGIMFWFLGLPGALLWGTVMAFVSIVPVLGAFLVWVPAAIYLALTGAILKAVILTVWGAVVIGSIDNILFPLLVGNKIRMHTLPIFFAILGGLMFFGAVGIVLGPATFAVTVALIEIWRRRTEHAQTADTAAS
jgi:predicted PurR-regulated permease PerM